MSLSHWDTSYYIMLLFDKKKLLLVLNSFKFNTKTIIYSTIKNIENPLKYVQIKENELIVVFGRIR